MPSFPSRRRSLCATGWTCALILSSAAAGADQTDTDAALDSFNSAMLSIFHRGQDMLTAQTLPIMVIARDVTVITAEGTQSFPRNAPQYQTLKATSHIVLGFIGAVTPWPEGDAGKTRWTQDFTRISQEIDRLLAALDASGAPEDGLAEQRQMLETARDFANGALSDGTLSRQAVSDVLNKMRPVWAKNMRAAARAELTALHSAISQARASMSDEDWARTYVVHHGGSSVKNVNVVRLYLQRIAPEKAAAGHFLFAENAHGTDALAKHAGYVRMQREVGAWAFGDPMRMEVDLLGYEAGAALDDMIPAPPPDFAPVAD